MTPAVADSEARRRARELGRFLRSRRERLQPANVGFPAGGSRRTPGLRREEVAALAGIGVTWYARLEMGQEVRPSLRTLLAIASVLRLDRAETEHVLGLAALDVRGEDDAQVDTANPALTRYLETAAGHAVVVSDENTTAQRWNVLAAALFGFSAPSPWRARNAVWSLFHDPSRRALYGDSFGVVARSLVGSLRRTIALGGNSVADEIQLGLREDQEFLTAWEWYDVSEGVRALAADPLTLDHPAAGMLTLYVVRTEIPGTRLELRHYVPVDARAAAQLDRLAELGARQRPP